MKDSLANALLGEVMGWSDVDPSTVETLGRLQVLARHKYDDYERFGPGRKFIESLAYWLQQFQPGHERTVALEFVLTHLVFISNDEMEQLVRILYRKVIQPTIRAYVAKKCDLPTYAVSAIERRPEFALARRRSLFLGLSDGARIDEFRRGNRELSNEQVYATYEVAASRLNEMRDQLRRDQSNLPDPNQFELVFLLDDFAGSGTSILRQEDGKFKGRLQKFSNLLSMDEEADVSAFSGADTEIHVCLYVATQQAIGHLNKQLARYTSAAWAKPPIVHAVQLFSQSQRIEADAAPEFYQLLDKYYDPAIEDSAKRVGGTSSKYGYAEGALPLVLAHNSPNNSLSLLWAPEPMRSLFPRFERHIDSRS